MCGRVVLIAVSLGMCRAALCQQTPQPIDVSFTATEDGTEQRYVVVLPTDFKADAPHDVLIALHGHGSDRWQFVNDTRDE
ncbi:MAG: alpha/beta hydrolase, partial [Candidatus Hydrogenedentes bacterium]|nr:alpha/beta hydrolase [Candidatus Hydrogenedentota bacterium]